MAAATIRDVAGEAHVSTATVSRVINGVGPVAEATRRRVLDTIQRLGYRPNAVARGLTTRRTRTIGLVISDITNPFFPEIARGVEDVLSTYGYNVILCNTGRDAVREAAYVGLLVEKRVDGIILASVRPETTYPAELDRDGIPWVLAGLRLPGIDHDCVVVDNVLGAYQATQHLLRLGHRRIGHITGPLRESVAQDRLAGYRQAIANYGLCNEDALAVESDFKQAGGYAATLRLLQVQPPITALFVGNDTMAIGALEAAYDSGFQVPRDLAVVGFDDISIASLHTIQLTTVAQPKTEIGAVATRMLLDKIECVNGDARRDAKVVLTPTLMVRKTCGANQGR